MWTYGQFIFKQFYPVIHGKNQIIFILVFDAKLYEMFKFQYSLRRIYNIYENYSIIFTQ